MSRQASYTIGGSQRFAKTYGAGDRVIIYPGDLVADGVRIVPAVDG